MWGQLVVVVSLTGLVMVIPGPDMVLVLRNTFLGGRRGGLLTSGGVLLGNLVHITYCLLGIGWLISQSIVAFAALKYAAALYLVYLGIMSFRSGAGVSHPGVVADRRPGHNWLAQGFINNVLNPKGALFYFGVFTVVIAPGTSAGEMTVLVASMMLVSASFWLLFVSTVDRPFIRESLTRSRKAASRVFGGVLILLGVRVAIAEP
jgi:threonine/homoserine/homoserine lactone efflux protein